MTVELYKKDDNIKYSIELHEENESNVNTGNNAKNSMRKSVTYIIGDTRTEFTDYVEDGKEEKKVHEDSIENEDINSLHVFIEYFNSDTFIQKYINCAKTLVKYERINNKDCYVIISNDSGFSTGSYAKIYVDKETKLPIQVIESFDNGEYITYFTYEFGTVTDDDFKFPDNASEYKKEEIINLNNDKENYQIGKASNLISEEDLTNISNLLKEYGLDNVDIFTSWVKEFNKEPYQNCGMVDTWTDYNKIEYNEAALADRWEKKHNQTDSDCRMTSFLLLKDHISTNKTIKENGSYLMFDIDAIDNNKKYELLKTNRESFITLFNEIDVKGLSKDEIKNAYSKKWNEYGISLKEGKFSLITVIMHDNYDNVVYVGHAGILLDLQDKFLFIEKIAFEQPYQITVLKSKEDLKNMLFSRKSYFGDKTEEGPFIYENNEVLFSYK